MTFTAFGIFKDLNITFRPTDEVLVMANMTNMIRVFNGLRIDPAINSTGVRLTGVEFHWNDYNGIREIQITGCLVDPGSAIEDIILGPMSPVSVTASGSEFNDLLHPNTVFDGDISTRWSSGQSLTQQPWIEIHLPGHALYSVGHLKVAPRDFRRKY